MADLSPETRILEHARRMDSAIERGDVDEAFREFHLMMRIWRYDLGHATETPNAAGRSASYLEFDWDPRHVR